MMRSRYLVLPLLAAFALPVVARADGLIGRRGCNSCGGGSGGGLFGGGAGCGRGGLGGGAGGNAAPAYTTKNGLGLFQPPFQASPWYLYWPYDQHFQMAAPIGAPFNAPQHLHTPWNPYFAHPGLGMGGPPQGFPGMPGHPGHPFPQHNGNGPAPVMANPGLGANVLPPAGRQ